MQVAGNRWAPSPLVVAVALKLGFWRPVPPESTSEAPAGEEATVMTVRRPPRRYYVLTDRGRVELTRIIEEKR